MAKKPVKLQLDDDPPRVVNGKWLRFKDRECDNQITVTRIDHIVSIMETDGGCMVVALGSDQSWIDGYRPDQILKLISDAEFDAALEKELKK